MNRTVGAGWKGVAAVLRSAGIQRVGDEEDEAGVNGVAGRCTVAVRHHLGAESELDLRSAPSPSASPSLSLEHHRRRRRSAVAENRDPRTAWRRVEELGYGESAGAAGPGALENAWEGSHLGHL